MSPATARRPLPLAALAAALTLLLLAGCATRSPGAAAADAAVGGSRLTGTTPAANDPAPAALPALGDKLVLADVLQLVATRNPAVQAAALRWRAASYQRGQVVALPDPTVEAAYYVVRGGESAEYAVRQAIPFPLKLTLAGKAADQETAVARLRYEAALRDALGEAKEVYFELYYLDRAAPVTEAVGTLYSRYAALAAAGTEVARPQLPETFRAESQRAQVGYDVALLAQQRATEADRLRALLALPPETPLGPTEELADPAALATQLPALQQLAAQYNQDLAAAGLEAERAHTQTRLARLAPIPDLMIGAGYKREVDHMSRNPISGIVGLSVPLWWGKYRAQAHEAEALEQAAQAEATGKGLELRAAVAGAYFRLATSERLVRLYRATLLPQARRALNSAEQLYGRGDANLAALLETTATVQNFELARLRASADYYQNVARLERLLGTALALQPAPAASPETTP